MKYLLFTLCILFPYLSNAQIGSIRIQIANLNTELTEQKKVAAKLNRDKNALLSALQQNRKINSGTKEELTNNSVSLYNLRGTLKRINEDNNNLKNKINILEKDNNERRELLNLNNTLTDNVRVQLSNANSTINNLQNQLKSYNQTKIVYDAKIEYRDKYSNKKNYDTEVEDDITEWIVKPNNRTVEFAAILNAGVTATNSFGYAYNFYPGVIFKNHIFIGLGIGQENYPYDSYSSTITAQTDAQVSLLSFSSTLLNLNIRGSFSENGIVYTEGGSLDDIENNLYCNLEIGTAFLKTNPSSAITSKSGLNLNFGVGAFYFFNEKVCIDANLGYKLQKYSFNKTIGFTKENDNSNGLCLKVGIIYKL